MRRDTRAASGRLHWHWHRGSCGRRKNALGRPLPCPELELTFRLRDEHLEPADRVAARGTRIAQERRLFRLVYEVVDHSSVERREPHWARARGNAASGNGVDEEIPRSGRGREDLGTAADEIRDLAGGVPAPRGNRDLRAAIRQRNGNRARRAAAAENGRAQAAQWNAIRQRSEESADVGVRAEPAAVAVDDR